MHLKDLIILKGIKSLSKVINYIIPQIYDKQHFDHANLPVCFFLELSVSFLCIQLHPPFRDHKSFDNFFPVQMVGWNWKYSQCHFHYNGRGLGSIVLILRNVNVHIVTSFHAEKIWLSIKSVLLTKQTLLERM